MQQIQAHAALLKSTGGNAWPPVGTFESTWPNILRPFADLCDRAADRFAVPVDEVVPVEGESIVANANVCPFAQKPSKKAGGNVCPFANNIKVSKKQSKDSEYTPNKVIVDSMRGWLREECLLLGSVDEIVRAAKGLDTQAKHGFLCCVTFLVHMYRWGVCPVVEYAQIQTTLEFPNQIYAPFRAINDEFGLSHSGTVYSMYLCNGIYDDEGNFQRCRFHFCGPKHAEIRKSEAYFMRLLIAMEAAAAPMIQAMVNCCASVEKKDHRAAEKSMTEVLEHSLAAYDEFSHWLCDCYIKHEFWMRYSQGPSGWGINGVGGLTGAQTLVLPALDAFLGLKGDSSTWHFGLNNRDHMTKAMRNMLVALDEFGLAYRLNNESFGIGMYDAYAKCVRRLRGFRIVHKYKVLPYFGVKAPERLPMTAGSGISEKSDLVTFFLKRLEDRVLETLSPVHPPKLCPETTSSMRASHIVLAPTFLALLVFYLVICNSALADWNLNDQE